MGCSRINKWICFCNSFLFHMFIRFSSCIWCMKSNCLRNGLTYILRMGKIIFNKKTSISYLFIGLFCKISFRWMPTKLILTTGSNWMCDICLKWIILFYYSDNNVIKSFMISTTLHICAFMNTTCYHLLSPTIRCNITAI